LGTPEVGRIGLGAMGMSAAYTGAGRDEAESIRTIHQAFVGHPRLRTSSLPRTFDGS
jgi:hypothetical protein